MLTGLLLVALLASPVPSPDPAMSSAVPISQPSSAPAPAISPASAPVPSSAEPICPSVLRLESTDGSDYSFVLGAGPPVTVAAYIELYGSSREYVVKLNAVNVRMPTTMRGAAVRSFTIDLHDPSGEPFAGASVELTPAGAAKPCPANVMVVAPPASVRSRIAARGSLGIDDVEVGAELIQSSQHPPAMLLELTKMYSCGTPFSDARILEVAQPAYPSFVSDSGTAEIRVDLDETGNVRRTTVFKSSGTAALDDSALHAAGATKYRPAIVACKNVGGSYIFRADFLGR